MKMLSKGCIPILIYVIMSMQVLLAQAVPGKKQKDDFAYKKISRGIPIRVLLEESAPKDIEWEVSADEGFILYAPISKEKTTITCTKLLITHKNGDFYLNGQKIADTHIYILPVRGLIRLGATAYDGVFSVSKTKDIAYLVNHLDLEEYLMSVLRYESMPGWPDEVHKALCIAVRSYAISKVLEQREHRGKNRASYPYDIKNTNSHQIYRGHEKNTCFRHIVEGTRDIVLAHNEKPILAMFDIACGGVIPGKKKGIHFNKAPYLKRIQPCNYCTECPYYRWDTSMLVTELEEEIKKIVPHCKRIRDIRVESYDQAGVVQQVKIRDTKGWHTITAAQLRSACKNIRGLWSLCFNVMKQGNMVTISGKGHGHHMGLCQWGAYRLVKKGWTYKRVLRFYYPNTTFMKLTRVE